MRFTIREEIKSNQFFYNYIRLNNIDDMDDIIIILCLKKLNC